MTAAQAASRGRWREVTGAVIATSLVLVAVFVPVALLPRHHRAHLPAVLADHRLLGGAVRVQRAHPHARRCRALLLSAEHAEQVACSSAGVDAAHRRG